MPRLLLPLLAALTGAAAPLPAADDPPKGDLLRFEFAQSKAFPGTARTVTVSLGELLPAVEARAAPDGRKRVLSKGGNDRAIGGASSGAAGRLPPGVQRHRLAHRAAGRSRLTCSNPQVRPGRAGERHHPDAHGRVSGLTFGGPGFDTVSATRGDTAFRRKVKAVGADGFRPPATPKPPKL